MRDLTEIEKRGGSLYGRCPNGHGDENGIIAAEVTKARMPFPNCPIGGAKIDTAVNPVYIDMTVYLAGPIQNDVSEKDWRGYVDSLRDDITWIHPEEGGTEVIEWDRMMIRKSDAVLVGDTGARSPGTWREVEYAETIGVPVVVWLDPFGEASIYPDQVSPWIKDIGHVSREVQTCLSVVISYGLTYHEAQRVIDLVNVPSVNDTVHHAAMIRKRRGQ